jgi:hypothetical protein
MHRFLTLILLFTGSAVAISAQSEADFEEDDLRPAEMETVDYSDFPRINAIDNLAFKILVTAPVTEDIFIRHDRDYKRLQPVRGISQTHYYDGANPLVIYRKGLDEEGEESYIPSGEAQLPTGSKDIILALKQTGATYTAIAIDMSLKGQSLRSVRFINFTPTNLVVLLNDQRDSILPGEDIVTRFKSEEKQYFKFKIGAMYEGQAKLIFSNRYPFRGNMRQLFIGYAVGSGDPAESPFRVIDHRDNGPDSRPNIIE